jgi:hypothetical protein
MPNLTAKESPLMPTRRRIRIPSWNRVAFLTLLCTASIMSARAQISIQDQVDFNTTRSDALLGTSFAPSNPPTIGSIVSYSMPGGFAVSKDDSTETPPQPLWNLNVLTPADYFTHTMAKGGTAESAEFTPTAKFGFQKRIGESAITVSGFLNEASDRYTGSPANTDVVNGSLRIDVGQSGSNPDRDAPDYFVSYSPQRSYAAFFDSVHATTRDFAIGINQLFDFLPRWRPVDGRAGFAQNWEIGLQISGQRRIVNPGADSYALIGGPSLKWAAVSEAEWPRLDLDKVGGLAASIGLNLTRRWYDVYHGESERVWTLAPIFTAVWQPPAKWLKSVPELDFQLAYSDQSSTIAPHRGHQWGIGPELKANWSF